MYHDWTCECVWYVFCIYICVLVCSCCVWIIHGAACMCGQITPVPAKSTFGSHVTIHSIPTVKKKRKKSKNNQVNTEQQQQLTETIFNHIYAIANVFVWLCVTHFVVANICWPSHLQFYCSTASNEREFVCCVNEKPVGLELSLKSTVRDGIYNILVCIETCVMRFASVIRGWSHLFRIRDVQ